MKFPVAILAVVAAAGVAHAGEAGAPVQKRGILSTGLYGGYAGAYGYGLPYASIAAPVAISKVVVPTVAKVAVPAYSAYPLGYSKLGYGLGYSGLGYSGLGYSGLGYSSLGYSGLGYSGLGYGHGLGYSKLGYGYSAYPYLGYSKVGLAYSAPYLW